MSAGPPNRQRLTRAMRLRAQSDFRRLKNEGGRLAQGCLIANWLPRSGAGGSRAAFITSRHIGSAVVRNRARRLLREAFRRQRQGLGQPLDLVLVARGSIAGKALADVEKDLLAAWRRAGLLKSTA
jgi:ribonuclease P protein component